MSDKCLLATHNQLGADLDVAAANQVRVSWHESKVNDVRELISGCGVWERLRDNARGR